MRFLVGWIIVLISFSCSFKTKEPNALCNVELEDIAKISLGHTVNYILDSIHYKTEEILFILEPPGIISSVILDCKEKGHVELFFERVSIISDSLGNNEHYLDKVKDKIINEIEWETPNGKKGNLKKVVLY